MMSEASVCTALHSTRRYVQGGIANSAVISTIITAKAYSNGADELLLELIVSKDHNARPLFPVESVQGAIIMSDPKLSRLLQTSGGSVLSAAGQA
jgi:hypothetical protein